VQLVVGIFWLVQTSKAFIFGNTQITSQSIQLFAVVSRWVPALGFSVGVDTFTTGMIAGRLIYHHQMQKKIGGAHTSPYLPLVTIFIESAALSLISKVIQISIQSYAIELNPIVLPLCVSKCIANHAVYLKADTHL
jgi:hypothetical protein